MQFMEGPTHHAFTGGPSLQLMGNLWALNMYISYNAIKTSSL